MTETQAKSGTAGASTTPVEGESAEGGAATGRAAVGRAAVPADAPSPKFTRAPGMAPPPDKPSDSDGKPEAPAAAGAKSSPGAPPTITRPGASARPAEAPGRPTEATATMTRPGAAPGPAPAGGPGQAASGQASAVGAARVTEAVRTARSTVAGGAARGPRRARLNVKRIDPWSVFKFSFAVSLVLFIVVIVATSVLYLALDAMGVFEKVNTSLGDLISASGGNEGSTFKITAKGVIGTSALIGVVNVVLFTALATLGAFIYNVCADLVGGVELTLAERD
ncbi:DUF3566 domain-containing protein [Asanoa sp. WMMD1127]|uniref:DUF3566 domain-containing protein n=1 Tax=Asanoa sp. WMMD1127 TaxID=3016107 RepID=UPI0024175974|nr:DUF3566 domain-containing protein [Asanoa sp. WMMD1127]MDG4822184.1 DUF3566 domain-containing protein [Asanoa sp. WMMD1127]